MSNAAEPAPLDAGGFAQIIDVSRETGARLGCYLDLLGRWQKRINLVGPRTLDDPWRRHVLDSAQLLTHLPDSAEADPRPLVDLGSGAGFPGLVLAICGVRPCVLIEADQRKAAFLREVARATGTEVEILACRIEAVPPVAARIITARALAPLPKLLALAERFQGPATQALFLKGSSLTQELTAAAKDWHTVAEMTPSLSDPRGVVLKLREFGRASHRQSRARADRAGDRHRQSEGRGR